MLPGARTKQYLEKEGWLVASVEKYLKVGGMAFGRRVDVYGFGDLLACCPGFAPGVSSDKPGLIALVQACAGGDHDRRRRKILGTTRDTDLAQMDQKERAELVRVAYRARVWKSAGGRILLVSWAKKGPRGTRKLWTPRIEEL